MAPNLDNRDLKGNKTRELPQGRATFFSYYSFSQWPSFLERENARLPNYAPKEFVYGGFLRAMDPGPCKQKQTHGTGYPWGSKVQTLQKTLAPEPLPWPPLPTTWMLPTGINNITLIPGGGGIRWGSQWGGPKTGNADARFSPDVPRLRLGLTRSPHLLRVLYHSCSSDWW